MVALATRFGRGFTTTQNGSRPLTEIEMRQVAPSIFAMEAHESRSARYAHIPTFEILQGLQREGFAPFMVAQSRCRVPGKSDFTKHMIRLRHADKIGRGGSPEIILVNSHDGTSSYQLMGGWFEFVCANGLIRGHCGEDLRVKHTGNVTNDVIQGAFTVLDTLEDVSDQRENMLLTHLNSDEQHIFARAALALRYDDVEKAPIEPERLLHIRHHEQREGNLWNTFNRVQENAIRGGLQGRTTDMRRTRTREVTGIDQGTKLNKALWILADEMRKLKSAA